MPRRDDDELAGWLDELGDAPGAERSPPPATPPPRPSRRLWALAALPWVVAAVLAVSAWAGIGRDAAAGRASPAPTGDATDATGPAGVDPGTGVDPGAGDAGAAPTPGGSAPAAAPERSRGADARGDGAAAIPAELAAAAERAVRTVGARRLARLEDTAVHVDHARATAVHALGGDGAARPDWLVTVAALVRRADGDRWQAPTPLRFAVVVDADGGLRAAPWTLPGRARVARVEQPAALEALELNAWPQLVEAATAALAQAGYDRPKVQALHRVGQGRALRVEAQATAPGARRRGPVVAWLDARARAVLGHRAAGASAPSRPTPGPTREAAPSPAPASPALPSPAPPSPVPSGDAAVRSTPSRSQEAP